MSRTGKIARLPQDIREQMNRRLQDGQSGRDVLDWVNALPECQQVLTEKFGGRPIDDGNLHEWRHGGYEEWLWHESRRARLQFLFERTANLDAVGNGYELSENLGNVVAAELAAALEMLEGFTDLNERWRRLREICRELSRLRRENCNGQRLRLAEQRWERLCEKEQLDQIEDRGNKLMTSFLGTSNSNRLTESDANSKCAEKPVDWLLRVHGHLPIPDQLNGKPRKDRTPPIPPPQPKPLRPISTNFD